MHFGCVNRAVAVGAVWSSYHSCFPDLFSSALRYFPKCFLIAGYALMSMPRCVKISHLSCGSLRDSVYRLHSPTLDVARHQKWLQNIRRKRIFPNECISRISRSTINASLHPVVIPREDCPLRYSSQWFTSVADFL